MVEITHQAPTPEELASFYLDAEWIKDAGSLDLRKSIANTAVWITAREGDEVVGMARLQTDYVRYCCVYDLIVRSDKRGRGIGTQIMQGIIAFCDEAGVLICHLWPTRGNAGFYERFGFRALDADQPVMVRRGGASGD